MEDLQSAASLFINTTSSHIFLTGKAGTGKTTFLKNLSKITHKSFIIVAPTGIAALNAGGVTIHSQFLLPPMTFIPDRRFSPQGFEEGRFVNQDILTRKHPLNSVRRQVLRSIDLLVIDEVSMLRADILDAIDFRMRAARGNHHQSFGGAQVLFIGDLYQLPPVVRREESEVLSAYYKSAWFYDAVALREDVPVYIELDKIFRQSDSSFITILNNLRNNSTTQQDIDTLNSYYKTPEEVSRLEETITLTTHNYKADEINQYELKNLKSPSCFFEAKMEGEFPESMFPVMLNLELKVGAQIMFVRNDIDKMYFNGKLATIKEISGENVWVEMAETHNRYQLKKVVWENKKYATADASHDLEEEVVGSFEQYPVKLAWAITVHKSQGLTFERAVIDVGNAFADGQVYVALSRLRSLSGLVLRTRINPSSISTDKQIVDYAKANHKPLELSEKMKDKQLQFVRQLLEATFDFSSLVKEIQNFQKNESKEEVADASMKPVLSQIRSSLEGEQVNTHRFRRQLAELMDANDFKMVVERLKKGSAYYKSHLFENIKLLLHHVETVKYGKRVKEYLKQLNDLDKSFSKKWEDIDKSSRLVEGIMESQETFDFNDLAQARAKDRNQLLEEIQKTIGDGPVESRKKQKSGKKGEKKDKRSTFEITLELINAGMTPEQVAEERGLASSTIETHLSRAVGEGKLDIFKFMNEEQVMEIISARRQLSPESTSKDLFEKLKGKFSYGQLRAVMAYDKLSIKN